MTIRSSLSITGVSKIRTNLVPTLRSKAHAGLKLYWVFVIRCCNIFTPSILFLKKSLHSVDIGGPQLSMHSIREMCCTSSIHQCTELYKVFIPVFSIFVSLFHVPCKQQFQVSEFSKSLFLGQLFLRILGLIFMFVCAAFKNIINLKMIWSY